MRAHFPLVWRYLRRLGLSDADADDAAQQVFLTTSRKLSQVDLGFERAFVLGVAVRVARDVRKAEQRRRTEPDSLLERAPDPGPDPERALERQRACALLDQLLEQLDDEARSVFALYEIEGLNMREIADALAKPAGTGRRGCLLGTKETSDDPKSMLGDGQHDSLVAGGMFGSRD